VGSHSGGCQLALHGDKLFLYSGHTVVVDKADKTETDLVHDDLWSLDLGTFTVHYPPMQQIFHALSTSRGNSVHARSQSSLVSTSNVSETYTQASLLRWCHIWQSAATRHRDSAHQSGPDDQICT